VAALQADYSESMSPLDPNSCRQARLSRDPRFDGLFFLAVTSTGIYCRPICPARPPRESNVRYFRTAAEAAQQGFRPCLRCRPESAPHSPAWRGTSTTVGRALQLIQEGYLNEQPLSRLAERLGVGERYLRKLFEQQLGVTPSVVAQTQRLHFAQKLLLETAMPITDVAHASGYGSIRRFNSATRKNFGCAAGELRRRPNAGVLNSGITLELNYRPPYDWEGVLGFFRRHTVTGLEDTRDGVYRRNLRTESGCARLRVSPHPDKPALLLNLSMPDTAGLVTIVATVRRMFDLDAQPADVSAGLAGDPIFANLLQRYPGIRAPANASVFEACVRAVLGQQVSTEAARKLCAKLLFACDSYVEQDGERFAVFPGPGELLALPDSALPMPGSRRQTLRAICEYFSTQQNMEDPQRVLTELAALKGIGPWTISILSLRGFGHPDSFPASDLGILNACKALEPMDKSTVARRAEDWKPWRSYATNLLWRSLSNE
jgi:AraC family transcriptional regulator of adaptative response / DNA-3-methyladenine glycosylase II